MGRLDIKTKVDLDGRTLSIGEDGLIRIDKIVLAKLILTPNDGIYIQVFDRDRMRSACRGTRLVTIPLDVLVGKLREEAFK